MKQFLYWLAGQLPCKIISEDGTPYLERYYLFTVLGIRFYLHRFVGSDPARGLHDHPWPWAGSVVLAGHYIEERRGYEQNETAIVLSRFFGTEGTTRTRVRWFNWMTGDTFHRVVLDKGLDNLEQPCWTLFFHRAVNAKPWGFLRTIEGHTAAFWVPHNYPLDGAAGSTGRWWRHVPRGNKSTRSPI